MSYGRIFPDTVWCCHQDNRIEMDMLLNRNKILPNSNSPKNKYKSSICVA